MRELCFPDMCDMPAEFTHQPHPSFPPHPQVLGQCHAPKVAGVALGAGVEAGGARGDDGNEEGTCSSGRGGCVGPQMGRRCTRATVVPPSKRGYDLSSRVWILKFFGWARTGAVLLEFFYG